MKFKRVAKHNRLSTKSKTTNLLNSVMDPAANLFAFDTENITYKAIERKLLTSFGTQEQRESRDI